MAKSDKKKPKEASQLFESIIKASVKEDAKSKVKTPKQQK